MAITEEQYQAALELQKRGKLSAEQSAAAQEIISRFSPSVSQEAIVAGQMRRASMLGPEPIIGPIPQESTGLGSVSGAALGAIATEMPGSTVGRTVGSVLGAALTRTPAGTTLGGNLGAFAGAVIGSSFGAGVGGAAGELAEQMASGLYRADNTLNDSFNMAVQAGEQEAAYDLIGGLLFRGGGSVFRKLLGSPVEAGAEEALGIMQRYDSYLSLDQIVDRAVLDEVSGALRGSLFSRGPFETLQASQDKAAVQFYDDFISAYAGAARDTLTPEGAGKLMLQTLRQGETVFDSAVSDMYSVLDRQLVLRSSRPTQVFQQTAPAQMGVRDKPAGRMVEAQQFERPVDVSKVRSRASSLVDAIKEIGDVDPKAEGTGLLRNIASGADRLTFSQTHTLISDLKRLQRSGRLQGLPAETKIGDFIGLLQNSFDAAGKTLPDDLAKEYAKMRSFTRFGKQKFESEFISKLMDNEAIDSQVITNVIVNAQPGDLVRLRQTLRLSDRFRGVPAGSSWKTVQGAFLDRVLPQNVEQIGRTPIANLKTDRQLQAQFKKIFSPTELGVIERNVDLMNRIVFKRPGSSALSGRQAGAGLRGLYAAGAGAVGLGAYQEGGLSGASAGVLTYLAAPALLSKAITSPKLTRALAAWDNALRITGPSRGNALVKVTRMLEEIRQEAFDEQ